MKTTQFRILCCLLLGTVISAKNKHKQKKHHNDRHKSNELKWERDLCQLLGYEKEFDFCAEIYFCHEGGNRDRALRGVEDDQERRANRSHDNGKFGWRLPDESSCKWPGPLIRMKRGFKYGLLVHGSGDEGVVTNLHTHGLHIAGHGNGDDVTRYVGGEDVIVYAMDIQEHHMGGTFWYHSHLHGHTKEQVSGGAFGMLIIDDDGKDMLTKDDKVEKLLASEEHELLMVASNMYAYTETWAVNGRQSMETYSLKAQTWYRLRILTVNLSDNNDMQTVTIGDQSCSVHALAHDGIFRFQVPATESQNDYPMSVSSRLDVAIKCSANSKISINGQDVAEIQVDDSAMEDDASPWKDGVEGQTWPSKRPPYLEDLRGKSVDNTYKLHVGETNINEQAYHATEPLCNDGKDFKYGTIQEWTFSSSTHPFHLHMYPMQVVSDNCGDDYEVGEYYDTISPDRKCTVRMNFVDIGGRTAFHCHIYRHGDQGAMGFINVVDAPKLPDEPRVFKCNNESCDVPVVPNLCQQ